MSTGTAFRFGWKAFLVCAVIVAVASINTPRAGRAYDPKRKATDATPTRDLKIADGPSRLSPSQRDGAIGQAPQMGGTASGSDSSVDASRREFPAGSAVRSVGGYGARTAFASSASALEGLLDPLCSQSANCQPPNHAAADISNRTDFRIADDFRPESNGSITQICWWGIYKQDGMDCLDATVTDSFEIKYCTDAGSVPSNICTTFKQSDGTLTVTGPTQTADVVFLSTAEFAFSATHAPFPVGAGQCYWVEITNDTGDCVWSWEVSAEGGDWAMVDGSSAGPPDGHELGAFLSHDLAFCVDTILSSDSACGPPDNAACPHESQDCCVGGPKDVVGCIDESCCRRVCACDPACCDPLVGWDPSCATAGVNQNGCGAEMVCPGVCSPCGGAESGDCCSANESANCNDAACCAAVCAVDEYCCETLWDAACADKADTVCQQLCTPLICGNPELPGCCEANPLVAGCSDATCCEAVCACDPACCDPDFGWDRNCATIGFRTSRCGALYTCEAVCHVCNLCGDVAADGMSIHGAGSNADLRDFAVFANCLGRNIRDFPECFCADLNDDQTISIADYPILNELFESTSANSPPNCVTP